MATTELTEPGTSGTARSGRKQVEVITSGNRVLLALFMYSMLLPVTVEIVGLNLTLSRVVLLVTMIPNLLLLISGRLGKFNWVDKLFIAHTFWIFLALFVIHGMGRLQFAGITGIEVLGSYLLGRACIRNADDFRFLFQQMMILMVIMFPFAVAETMTGELYMAQWLGWAGEIVERHRSAFARMGFERVYAIFNHPIHFGIFCSMTLSGIFYVFRGPFFSKLLAALFTFAMTFMSLSAGPLLAYVIQCGIAVWGGVTRGAYWRLVQLGIFSYVAIDLLSDRTPARIFVGMLTFNPGSGWARIIQWEYASREVNASPFFGIGFNNWARPHWVMNSIDNFWLATAMRYGYVGAGLLIAAFLVQAIIVGRTKIENEEARRCRVAFNTILAGVSFTMVAVHVWGVIATFIFLFLGAGTWLHTNPKILAGSADLKPEQQTPATRGPRYTRFGKHGILPGARRSK